ncbi:MAG: endo-1,4-beta-xylanase [Defluviitaleaceae bacterium]|nr:endo-1,4-beta-xylanase [Defluviitaleaceae bacterium]
MKKFILAAFSAIILIFTLGAASPDSGEIDEIFVTINGEPVIFADQAPAVIDGRTLVPVRGVFERLGFRVDWDDDARAAILFRDGVTILIAPDADYFAIYTVQTNVAGYNGNPVGADTVPLEVPAQTIGGRTMLPIRALLESMGYEVAWDGQTVIITTFTAPAEEPPVQQHYHTPPLSEEVPEIETESQEEPSPEIPRGYVYSLAHDPDISELSPGANISSGTLNLRRSGGATLTVTETGGINVSGRQNNWDGIDMPIYALNITPDASYTIEITGRAISPIPANAEMFLQLSADGSWPWLGGEPVSAQNPEFTLTYTFTAQNEYNGRPFSDFGFFRIQTNSEAAAMSFVVDSIVVTTGTPRTFEVPPPPENLTGADIPSLAEAFADYFMVGNIWGGHTGRNRILQHPGAAEHFLHHYNAITAENHHKPNNFANRANFNNPADWNWAESDFIINWAYENNLYMVGHVLVWHSQSHLWFTTASGSTTPLTRAEAVANMEHHISTVAGRYRGRVDVWEVVNEVFVGISPDDWRRNPDWRHFVRRANAGLDPQFYSQWYNAFANGARSGQCGSDFIYYAFRFARLADPNALLKYNDYGEYNPGKREAIAQMTEQVNARWRNDPLYDGRLLIEILGMQGHYTIEWTDLRQVRATIERFAATGARIHITELDVRFGELTDWSAGFHSPARRQLTNAELRRQATMYRNLFALFMEFSDYIDRVSFWGMTDEWSWLSMGWPLLFTLDGNEFVPKPAFWSILELVD